MLNNAIHAVNKQELNVKSIGIYYNDKECYHHFETGKFDIRSISKTVMTLVCLYITENTNLTLDSYVYPIIRDHVTLENIDNLDKLNKVKIRHCLNHTIGFDKVLLMRQDIKDIDESEYLNLIINEPIEHAPGTQYLYSNAGFYLLSATLQIYLKQDLEDYIKKHIFSTLEITDYTWERYGAYLAGATRLHLKAEDLMKFGFLLLNDGVYKSKRIIKKENIDYMKSITTKTAQVDTVGQLLRRYAYGQGIWLAKENGIFFAHGTDSQMLIIMPQKKAVLLALSDHSNLSDVEKIMNALMLNL